MRTDYTIRGSCLTNYDVYMVVRVIMSYIVHKLTITMCAINENITLATGTHVRTVSVVTIVFTTSILQYTLIHIYIYIKRKEK